MEVTHSEIYHKVDGQKQRLIFRDMAQTEVNDITAPHMVDIPIRDTGRFIRGATDVLKKQSGISGSITADFMAEDATKYTVDGVNADQSPYVAFDGAMKPITEYDIPVSEPVALDSGMTCETGVIDFDVYKSVENLTLDCGCREIKQISTSDYETIYFLLTNKTVKACGYNATGQLGLGDTTNRLVPTLIPGLTDVEQIVADGDSCYFLLTNKTVKVCGGNTYGQLSLGDKTNRLVPTLIPGLENVEQVAIKRQSCYFLLADKTVKVCGRNDYGQLGLGNTINQLIPMLIPSLSSVKQIVVSNSDTSTRGVAGAEQIVISDSYTCYFLLADKTVKAWGKNDYGQLGLGNTTNQFVPTLIQGLINVEQIHPENYACYFHLSDETVKACGLNATGQLGLGDKTTRLVPTLIPGLTDVEQIVAGNGLCFFILPNKTVKACGSSNIGTLGVGDTKGRLTPTLISGLSGVEQIVVGNGTTFFILTNKTVKGCGSNSFGQLGIEDKSNQLVPILIPGLENVEKLIVQSQNYYFLMADKTVKTYMRNGYAYKSLQDLSDVEQVVTNNGSCYFFLTDKTVKAWGGNSSGQLGLGDTKGCFAAPLLILSFTPFEAQYLYCKDNATYSGTSSLVLVSGEYASLSESEKMTLFASAGTELASLDQIITLGKVKIAFHQENIDAANKPTCTLAAIPQKVVLPKNLFTIGAITKATVAANTTGSSAVKIVVTINGDTYKTLANGVWETIDHTDPVAVAAGGIDSAALADITASQWNDLLSGATSIGFAYLLGMDRTSDTCEVSQLDLQIESVPRWLMALPGTDYTYEYPDNATLRVSLLTDGSYKINYPI